MANNCKQLILFFHQAITHYQSLAKESNEAIDTKNSIWMGVVANEFRTLRNSLAERSSNVALELAKYSIAHECQKRSLEISHEIRNDGTVRFTNIRDDSYAINKVLMSKNCHISKLDYSRQGIKDNDKRLFQLKTLVNVIQKDDNNLKVLDLSYNKITNRGLNEIVSALNHSNCRLQKLNLQNNLIDKDGVFKIISFLGQSGQKSLKSLSLRGNLVMPESLDEIFCMMEKCFFQMKNIDLGLDNLLKLSDKPELHLQKISEWRNKFPDIQIH